MQVRKIVESEYDLVQQLGAFAFQYTPEPGGKERFYERLKRSAVWGVFVEDRLASSMLVTAFETYAHGTAIPTGGVAAVASWPEFRRQGHIRAMMTEAFGEMRKTGQVLSNLFPFKESFYAAFGWEPAGARHKYKMPMAQCPRFSQPEGSVRPAAGWNELNRIHQQFAERINGAHKRDEYWWTYSILRDERRACIYERDGQLEGYLVYQVKDFKFTAVEWVSLTIEARRALWNFVANHDSMADTLNWVGPADDRELRYIPDPPEEIRHALGHMSRIIDLPAFVEAAVPAMTGTPLRIALEDLQCPWNHGIWEFGGETGITKLASSIPDDQGYDARCGISGLTGMLLGTVTAAELHETRRLVGDAQAVTSLTERFPKVPCISMDFY